MTVCAPNVALVPAFLQCESNTLDEKVKQDEQSEACFTRRSRFINKRQDKSTLRAREREREGARGSERERWFSVLRLDGGKQTTKARKSDNSKAIQKDICTNQITHPRYAKDLLQKVRALP